MSYTNSMVAHLWAQGEKDHARSSNWNFSFRDASLYSYSTEIGRIVRAPATGERVALLTTRHYSITTSAHMSLALSAVRHLPTFYVNLPSRVVDFAAELERMHTDYRKLCQKLQRARYWYAGRADELHSAEANIREFARLFDLPAPVIDSHADVAAIEAARAARETPEAVAKRERERELRKARAARTEEEKVARWRNGERVTLTNVLGVMLRARGDTLETSMGAKVPLADAIKVFRFAAAVRAKGEDWHPNGLRGPAIGDFTLSAIRADGTIIAGCHTIAWAESERLALELGVSHENELAPAHNS